MPGVTCTLANFCKLTVVATRVTCTDALTVLTSDTEEASMTRNEVGTRTERSVWHGHAVIYV